MLQVYYLCKCLYIVFSVLIVIFFKLPCFFINSQSSGVSAIMSLLSQVSEVNYMYFYILFAVFAVSL